MTTNADRNADRMIELDILRKQMWDLEASFYLSPEISEREYDKQMNQLVNKANRLMIIIYGLKNLDNKECPCGLYHANDNNKANF
jgi:hypothetical protein